MEIKSYNNLVCCGNCKHAGWEYYSNVCEIADRDGCIEHDNFCDRFEGVNKLINYIKPKELTYE